MKTLVGIISGLLLVVAVAGFAPRDASAHASFAPAALSDGNPVDAIAGCVDDEVADTLIASGAFILDPGVVCGFDGDDHTRVVRFLP